MRIRVNEGFILNSKTEQKSVDLLFKGIDADLAYAIRALGMSQSPQWDQRYLLERMFWALSRELAKEKESQNTVCYKIENFFKAKQD